MAKNRKWSYVYDGNRDKLEKYFGKKIDTDVYIRLFTIPNKGYRFFQMSGNVTGFASRFVTNDVVFNEILVDFPFIKEYIPEDLRN